MGAVEKFPATSPVLDAALRYAARGWPVVPVYDIDADGQCGCGKPGCTNKGKHPKAANGFNSAVTDEALIRRLFRAFANVGIATGRTAGIWVLDIDAKDGGEDTLLALIERHGDLPNTVEARTGGGGRHLFFRYPPDRTVRNTVKRLGPGLDTRSDGGGVVSAPSVHESGRAYSWAPGLGPDDLDPADAPDWLYDLLDALDRRSADRVATMVGVPTPELRNVVAGYVEKALLDETRKVASATEGIRNVTLVEAARNLGGFVGAGVLDRAEVEASLTTAALLCGLTRPEIVATLKSGLDFGVARPRDLKNLGVVQREQKRPQANAEAQAVRRKRLRDNPLASEWLARLGLTAETVERFGFGLDQPYESPKTGKVYADSLTFPLRVADGTPVSTICKADIRGVTKNPKGALWSNGDPQTFYAEPQREQSAVLVLDMPDLWRLWQELQGTPAADRLQLIASSQDADLPSEWRKAEFWDRWRAIYVCTRPGEGAEKTALLISRSAGQPVMRVPPTRGRSWIEAFDGGEDVDGLEEALTGAVEIADRIEEERADKEVPLGRLAYRPLDIGRAYHNGNLYYPCDTLIRAHETDKEGNVRTVERIETVVVRSDAKLLHAVEVPAPKNTPLDKRVMRLNDGTLIDSMPKASASASWSWPAITKWLDERQAGKKVKHRPLAAILADVMEALRRSLWLPYEDDYAVLALAAAASYSQAVFQAVPLLLLCGSAGTGKSTAGIMMAQMSANGTIVGQVNAAAAARLIHETKGLIVLDDLEGIAAKAGREGGSFSELIQWLKVSYNRDTATKVWVDASRGFKVERLNGFGIKVINNTQGADSILGSRMIRIQTVKMPEAVAKTRVGLTPIPADQVQRLRDELHAWTFDHVDQIADTYAEVCPSASERSEEIAAPLRVLARLAGDPVLTARLEAALARSKVATVNPDTPEEILDEAAKLLAQQGYKEISPTHVIMEMKRLVDAYFGQTSTTEIPEFQQPEWVGRTLRNRDIVDPASAGRRERLYGKNLRIYPFSRNFLMQALDADVPPPEKDATAFCAGCDSCPYRGHGCSIIDARLEAEKKAAKRAARH
ncbi:bifunctional DNA primase/polymerase [Azospirillum sp. YIM DDC1]|uniref:Bifunctional DNA primase/polymerase n=1 Tax=Azospirillum aestuarii TaxID=2802052 RepID=A0ABS1I8S4_9PROT|nr:bifunctional DNA primase/polymerase [Azospirillum aestuarii]MBK4723405.1 bifunctional DNA primase/polymerase [Azospirillum aestuarii]